MVGYWGYNDHGQLGLGNYTTTAISSGTATNWVVAGGNSHIAIKSDGLGETQRHQD